MKEMKVDESNPLVMIFVNHLKHYNHKRYWRIRSEVINPNSKYPKILRLLWLYQIKKSDAFNNASMGTGFGRGANFKTPPILPHLLNGIIVSYGAKIGSNCRIYQQVTIGWNGGGDAGEPIIGDNVIIGAGAKIIGKVTIGDNVKIGANAVVFRDVPSNCTVVGSSMRIIERNIDTTIDDCNVCEK